ncbi:hypothetical protein I553_3685, partial [Mycobacterium xenopi 4042]
MRILKPDRRDRHRKRRSPLGRPPPGAPTPAPARDLARPELLNHPITAQVLLSVWTATLWSWCHPARCGQDQARCAALRGVGASGRPAGWYCAQTRAQAVDIARRLGAVADWRLIGLL